MLVLFVGLLALAVVPIRRVGTVLATIVVLVIAAFAIMLIPNWVALAVDIQT